MFDVRVSPLLHFDYCHDFNVKATSFNKSLSHVRVNLDISNIFFERKKKGKKKRKEKKRAKKQTDAEYSNLKPSEWRGAVITNPQALFINFSAFYDTLLSYSNAPLIDRLIMVIEMSGVQFGLKSYA